MFELLGEMTDVRTEGMKEERKRDGRKDSQISEFPQAREGTTGVLDCSGNVIVVELPIDREREREKKRECEVRWSSLGPVSILLAGTWLRATGSTPHTPRDTHLV